MLIVLSTITNLKTLSLKFQSPQSRPSRSNHASLQTRSVLPALKYFSFKGVCEYLEDLVAGIDAPQLITLNISFFDQIEFDTPQFIQFVTRTSLAGLEAPIEADVHLGGRTGVALMTRWSHDGVLDLKIGCGKWGGQISSLARVLNSSLPPFSALETLYIYKCKNLKHFEYLEPDNNLTRKQENMLWLELFCSFTAVKKLYISKEFLPRVIPALQELVGDRATEVLPSLQKLYLHGIETEYGRSVEEGLHQFLNAQLDAGRFVDAFHWRREF